MNGEQKMALYTVDLAEVFLGVGFQWCHVSVTLCKKVYLYKT